MTSFLFRRRHEQTYQTLVSFLAKLDLFLQLFLTPSIPLASSLKMIYFLMEY